MLVLVILLLQEDAPLDPPQRSFVVADFSRPERTLLIDFEEIEKVANARGVTHRSILEMQAFKIQLSAHLLPNCRHLTEIVRGEAIQEI